LIISLFSLYFKEFILADFKFKISKKYNIF